MSRRVAAVVFALAAFAACSSDGGTPALPALNASTAAATATPYTADATLRVRASNATAYRIVDRADAGDVAKLASALKVSGKVQTSHDVWSVGDAAATLVVQRRGGQSFTMRRLGASAAGPADPKTAEQSATDVLNAGGVPLSGFTATVVPNLNSTSVRFTPTLKPAVDAFSNFVELDKGGSVLSASGYLGRISKQGTYDLTSVARAIERLNAVQSSVTPARLVKVDLVLEPSVDRRGDAWLTPAYRFTTDTNGSIATSAIADESLQEAITNDTTTTEAAPDDATNCASTPPNQSIDPTNAPIAAEVCADKASYEAGEVATFSINAADADRGFASGPCFDGVRTDYGDGAGGDVTCQACVASLPDDAPKQLLRVKAHTYNKPGSFIATFTIKSGADCGGDNPQDSSATLSLTVVVK